MSRPPSRTGVTLMELLVVLLVLAVLSALLVPVVVRPSAQARGVMSAARVRAVEAGKATPFRCGGGDGSNAPRAGLDGLATAWPDGTLTRTLATAGDSAADATACREAGDAGPGDQ